MWHKRLLTLEEAAAYVGLGEKRMKALSHDPDFERSVMCLVGRRRMFRRRPLEDYLDMWSGVE